jgi:hypothetical protein
MVSPFVALAVGFYAIGVYAVFQEASLIARKCGKLWEFDRAPDGLKVSALQFGFICTENIISGFDEVNRNLTIYPGRSIEHIRLLVAHHRHLKDSPLNSEHI